MDWKFAEAFAARKADVREKIEAVRENVKFIHSSAPSLTTALVVVVMFAGGLVGWFASSWVTRSNVNAEWRERIAAKSATVRSVIETGNAEISATDDEVINALGDTDARLTQAETALRSIKVAKPANGGECRIPRDSLRGQ